jgi:DNA-3-methyladenine glycosylase
LVNGFFNCFQVLYNTSMALSSCPPRDWYARDSLLVARELLGMRLVRLLDGERVGGMITETEAYRGEMDMASHARMGVTPRNSVMFGPPGHAYVYFTYGMHWCMNVVCMPQGTASAVLIRAIQPTLGLEIIAARRAGRPREIWTDGPAKLAQALGIDGQLNGIDLTTPSAGLWIEAGEPVPDEQVVIGPRVGIQNVPEPWRSMPWRFQINSAPGILRKG